MALQMQGQDFRTGNLAIMGGVWAFDMDGTWQKEWRFHKQSLVGKLG